MRDKNLTLSDSARNNSSHRAEVTLLDPFVDQAGLTLDDRAAWRTRQQAITPSGLTLAQQTLDSLHQI
ncbi:hypothetical protein [Nocardia sp. NPDC059228]|uniref:hypothetical protein n=1 Tax=Nocardia sp. NPDC059228 TaxID=3346777 RepID=UPI0036BE395E